MVVYTQCNFAFNIKYWPSNRLYSILCYSILRLFHNLIHSQFVFPLTCLSVYPDQTHAQSFSLTTLRPMQATTTLYFQFQFSPFICFHLYLYAALKSGESPPGGAPLT